MLLGPSSKVHVGDFFVMFILTPVTAYFLVQQIRYI